MKCDQTRESLESYVAGDLDGARAGQVAEHLERCADCSRERDRVREIARGLAGLRHAYAPRQVFDPSLLEQKKARGFGRSGAWGWRLATVAALLLAAMSLSVLAIPALAENLTVLPVSERLASLKADNARLAKKVDTLEIEIREIEGKKVPVIETAKPKLPAEVNLAVQTLAMHFIDAQYARNLSAMRALATDKLKADLAKHPDIYLREGGPVVFAQMTDVSKSGGTFLLFVRLMDSKEWNSSQYQEDFEIRKVGDTYLIDFVGMDA
jgi:hypothetical protein